LKLTSWEIAVIGVFAALHFVVASLNLFFAMFAHALTDAILCTCILLVAIHITQRPGVASLIGVVTGLLFFVFGTPFVAIPAWLVRGAIFDLVIFGLMHHKACCIKCCGVSAPASFFASTMLGFTLSSIFLVGYKPFFFSITLFIVLTIIGSALSVFGAYLALKINARIAPVIRRMITVEEVR